MDASTISAGALVRLQELNPSSANFKQGASFRVIGKASKFGILKCLLRYKSSLYQFIGELQIEPNNEGILKARVGRNVDGLDINLYHQTMQLERQFQAEQADIRTS
ncbi:hypothetical protein SASPL_109399 [Salvia splendens]|uniref:CST complex subunit TEN1 n=1 Tax=Salvia splendens TaxID=180675 RepID=A0A8X8YG92_SALSN|nr:hypothetical protein SASPL_109399 [Salvia splendens]